MDILELLGRAALVFALLGVTLYVVRRTDGGRRLAAKQSPLQVLGTTRLAKGASLSLVQVGGTAYALGVTEHAVTLLTETPLPTPAQPAEPAGRPAGPADRSTAARPSFAAALQSQLALRLGRTPAETTDRPYDASARRTDQLYDQATDPPEPAATDNEPDSGASTQSSTNGSTDDSTTAADGTAATDTAGASPAGEKPRKDARTKPALEPACPPSRPAPRPAPRPAQRRSADAAAPGRS